MASTPTTSRALPPNMIQLPPAPTWGHEVSSTSSDDSDLSEDASRRRHGRTQSLAPGSPYSTTHHSRNNSSVSFTLSPRPSSPNRAYSPFSAASERDSFLPPPASSPYRTSSPSIKTELSYFFENHTPLPPTSKRGRAQWLLLLAVPAVLLVLFFTAGNTMEGSQKLSDSWGGFKEHLGEGLKASDGWKERLVSSAKSPSWKAEVKEMDVLIEEARIADKDTIEISVSPIPRIPEDGEMKYLGYLPHSGEYRARRSARRDTRTDLRSLRLPQPAERACPSAHPRQDAEPHGVTPHIAGYRFSSSAADTSLQARSSLLGGLADSLELLYLPTGNLEPSHPHQRSFVRPSRRPPLSSLRPRQPHLVARRVPHARIRNQ